MATIVHIHSDYFEHVLEAQGGQSDTIGDIAIVEHSTTQNELLMSFLHEIHSNLHA